MSSIRIVTWNSSSGGCLERAAELAPLLADIVVIQECSRPVAGATGAGWAWFGENSRKGVGVVAGAGYEVHTGPLDAAVTHSTFPVVVSRAGDTRPLLHLLAVCSEPVPSYVGAIRAGLRAYAAFLRAAPAVVIGDFNSSPAFAPAAGPRSHASLTDELRDDLGLVSAYHAFRQRSQPGASEEPTYYHQWRADKPFHIDYCFLPAEWAASIRNVHVGSFAEWQGRSDHRPLLVELDSRSLPNDATAR